MTDIQKTKALMRTIIDLHESKDYDTLLPYISKEEVKKETWFTRKRFMEVCEAIESEIGKINSLEHIKTLKRRTSLLTLWKTTYNKNNDEVLWQVTFDATSNKVLLMHINWEKPGK